MNLFDAFHDELEKIALRLGTVRNARRLAQIRANRLEQAASVMPRTGTATINPRNIPGSSVPGGPRSFPPPAYQKGPGVTRQQMVAAAAERKRQARLFKEYGKDIRGGGNPYNPTDPSQAITPSTRKVKPRQMAAVEDAAGRPKPGSGFTGRENRAPWGMSNLF